MRDDYSAVRVTFATFWMVDTSINSNDRASYSQFVIHTPRPRLRFLASHDEGDANSHELMASSRWCHVTLGALERSAGS